LGSAAHTRHGSGGRERAVHILSPFDPLIVQRKRFALFFGYKDVFEAYVSKQKRMFGYFALPVLVDDEIVAVIDLKTDRANRAMLIQQWTWTGKADPAPVEGAPAGSRVPAGLETFVVRVWQSEPGCVTTNSRNVFQRRRHGLSHLPTARTSAGRRPGSWR
jgi:hypothetical protein